MKYSRYHPDNNENHCSKKEIYIDILALYLVIIMIFKEMAIVVVVFRININKLINLLVVENYNNIFEYQFYWG